MLVEFGENRKVVSLTEGKAICSIIKEVFGIDGEVIIQLFNKEWQEFIDLDGNDVVEDRAKLRVIAKVGSICTPTSKGKCSVRLFNELFIKLLLKLSVNFLDVCMKGNFV